MDWGKKMISDSTGIHELEKCKTPEEIKRLVNRTLDALHGEDVQKGETDEQEKTK